jgi:hypothetical protein
LNSCRQHCCCCCWPDHGPGQNQAWHLPLLLLLPLLLG